MVAPISKLFTPYSSVNTVVEHVLRNVEIILGDNFVGIYLFGSLAVGDFDPETSDVDMLIASARPLSVSEVDRLSEFHKTLFSSGLQYADQLECFYAAKSDLLGFKQGVSPCYKVDRGSGGLRLETLDADWVINSFSLQNHGIAVAGPDVKTILASVSVESLKSGIRELMETWWLPIAQNRLKLEHPGYRFYAILTMARMLATLDLNQIISKKAAVKYAVSKCEKRWVQLIEMAQAREVTASIEETQEFIRYTSTRLNSN